MTIRFLTSLMICLLCFVMPASSQGAGAADAVDRIQKAYEGISDMKGSFVQKNVIRDLNRTDSYRGEFMVKRPLRMKWSYKGKAAQDLTINDKTVLIHKKGDKQAYRSVFSKDAFGQTPVVLLTGMGSIRDEFQVSGSGNTLLLKPKKPMPGIVSITLLLSENGFPIRGFTIQDGRSNSVEILLSNIVLNSGLKDALFDLTLPDGVSVYEQNP